MDENLLKLLELVEKDKVLFQLLRQCPYEILRNFKVRKYKDSRFVLKQGEIYNTFYIVKWIRMDNNFNEYMIRTLCSNSYRMCANMGQNTLYTLKQRICQYLVGNAGADGKLRFVVSSEILSQKMAVTQRSVNRVLKQLKEQGLIELNKGNIAIKDYDALNRERN